MNLLDNLINTLPDGKVNNIIIGLNWTAVSVEVDTKQYCGLASTVRKHHSHGKGFDVPEAGRLLSYSAKELASMSKSEMPTLAGVGVAAINALCQTWSQAFTEENAETIVSRLGKDRNVAVVGHFPFTERLKREVKRLDVLENDPQPGDLDAEWAGEILPEAQVVAITGMTLINHTLQPLLKLCPKSAQVLLLGASTPLHPVLYDYGIDYLCGAITIDIEPVLMAVSQGATYPQIVKVGLRLVTMREEQNDA